MAARSDKLELVALGETRQHPLSRQLAKRYGIPPPAHIPGELLRMPGLLSLSRMFVFDAVIVTNMYACIGNFRVYALLKELLPPSTAISVRVRSRLRPQDLERQILHELVVMPVLAGLQKREMPRLANAWDRLATEGVLRELFLETGARGLARLLHVDARPLRRTNA